MSETTRPTDPASGAFAARYGLVRPLQGRYVAGVCAALGRATRTDPVLWRVVLPVLTCFGGVGVVIYLGLWLGTPEEGDAASPIEGVLGRGYSSMSPMLVAVLGGLAGITLVFALFQPFGLVLLAATALLASILLVQRNPTVPTPAPSPAAQPTPPPATGSPTAETPTVPAAPLAAAPDTFVPVAPAPPAVPGGYRPPFAPYGPFAFAPPAAPAPRPQRPPRQRPALTPITCFGTLVLLGLIGLIDLTGAASVPATGYLAAALTSVGVGLVVGTWLGRGRALIAVGTALALALPTAHVLAEWDPPEHVATEVTWAPTSYDEVWGEYRLMLGDGTLDLRQVDFTGERAEIAGEISFGDLRIYLPPDVDLEIDVAVRMGEANILGSRVSGNGSRRVEAAGTAGVDGGTLHLNLDVRFSNLEVYR